MAIPWRSVAAALAVVVVAVSSAWYWTTHTEAERPFDSCHFEGGVLVLKWTGGANERVSPQLDTRANALVASLRVKAGGGSSPSVGLPGEARLTVYGDSREVRDSSGAVLTCPTR